MGPGEESGVGSNHRRMSRVACGGVDEQRNDHVAKDLSCKIPENTPYSQPYWLRQPGTLGTFAVDDQKLIGLPENPPHLPMEITLQVNEQELRYTVDTRYRTVDPVAGELRQPLVIAPPVFTDFANGVLMFATNQPKSVPVRVTAASGSVKGQLKLAAPEGWRVAPTAVPIDLKGADAEMVAAFTVKPPEQDSEGTLRAIATIDGREYSFGRVRISYPHIGVHTLMPAAEVKVVRADIRKKGERIGYIPGPGDDVPESLQQIGYTVKMLSEADITAK